MAVLTVRNFSCIEFAVFELRPITILIGRQASGKSVIAKLFHFFSSLKTNFYDAAQDGSTFRILKKDIAKEFIESFPSIAWGMKQFTIDFSAGEFRVTVTRRVSGKRLLADIDIETSRFFEVHYESVRKQYRSSKRRMPAEDDFSPVFNQDTWRIRSESYALLMKSLAYNFIAYQMFIPAGRSFYTNLQKTVTVFEHGAQVDDVTKDFGRVPVNSGSNLDEPRSLAL